MTKPDIHRWGEIPEQDSPKWFGVSVGRLAYAAKVTKAERAKELVADELGRTVEEMVIVPTFIELYGDEEQRLLDEKHPQRELVRLIPFSPEEWPIDVALATESQRQALKNMSI